MSLTKNLKELEIILDNIHEAVCIIDRDYRIRYWNRSAEKLYGYSKEELYGKSINKKFPNALLAKSLETNKSYRQNEHRPNKNAHVIVSTSPIVIDGELMGAVSTDRDITEVKRLSSRLNREQERIKGLKSQIKNHDMGFEDITGKSDSIRESIKLAKKVSRTNASVLLTGESGTGKDVFARAIHKESGRKGDFVPVNSSAIPSNLLESELFGYEKGSFTGAIESGKLGKFELANKGTLFLDEIGDMPFDMQAKILRVLQDKVVYRIGGNSGRELDIRIIAATNKNLEEMVRRGEFREDLYYRLNVVPIELPALRDRQEDIEGLVYSFIEEFSQENKYEDISITDEALDYLTSYSWKGNIRELKNVVERILILSDGHIIDTEYIPRDIINSKRLEDKSNLNLDGLMLNEAVEKFERDMILDALEKENNNKAKAAKRLGINRSTLYYKMGVYENAEDSC